MESTGRSLAIVIPVFNEALALPELFERLDSTFLPERIRPYRLSRVHFLFVDDGSTDPTATILAERIRSGWPATLIRLSRNFGHQPALTAGLDLVQADLIGVIDADLQDPPELLLQMIAKLDEGCDVVYGERQSREGAWYKKLAYWGFYRLFGIMSDVRVPLDAGDFCLMKASVVLALRQLPEKLRFHRGLRSWVGFRHAALAYDRPGRSRGQSKYNFRMLYKLATDGIASLSIRPLRITQAILFFSLLLTVGSVGFSVYRILQSTSSDPALITALTTQGLIAFTSSLQIFCLYILGAYIGRMYLEVKSRPPYIVMETVNGPHSTDRA